MSRVSEIFMYINSTSKPDISTEAIEIAAPRYKFLENHRATMIDFILLRRSGVIEIHTSRTTFKISQGELEVSLNLWCIYPRPIAINNIKTPAPKNDFSLSQNTHSQCSSYSYHPRPIHWDLFLPLRYPSP